MPQFGGLRWRRKDIVIMEENYNNADEEKNIFYEYFSKLEKIDFEDATTTEELHKVYKNFKDIHNEILKTVDECYRTTLNSKFSTLYKYKEVRNTYLLIEKNLFPQYKNAVYGCFFTFKNFFNQFVATKQNGIKNIIRIIENLIGVTNYKLSFIIGGVKVLCNISNIIEWLYVTIISSINKSNEAELFSLGCQVLKLNKISYCKFISKDIYRCKKALEPKSIFRTITEDILPLIKLFKLRSVTPNIPNINEFKKYFIIADYAYKKFSIYKDKSLIQNQWYLPQKKYKINNDRFNFNNMVYGIVLDNHIDEIAIGFCGTDICHRPLTILIDASQIANVSPGYVYAVGLVTHIKNETPNKKIVVCGHSLGGGLAQFATATQENNVSAYCYNSAGLLGESLKVINQFSPFSNIYHYRLEWDYVSCFGRLLNIVYTAKSTRLMCFNHSRKALKKSLGL